MGFGVVDEAGIEVSELVGKLCDLATMFLFRDEAMDMDACICVSFVV